MGDEQLNGASKPFEIGDRVRLIRACRFCGMEFDRGTALVQHERFCRKNPEPAPKYLGTGHPLKPGFTAVHLVINEREWVKKYARIWEELGSMSHRDTVKTMIDIVLERLEMTDDEVKIDRS